MKMGKDALIVTKRKLKFKEFCARGCRDGGKELEIRVNDSTMWVWGGGIECGEKRKESRGCAD